MAESAGLELAMASGMTFDPIANRWRLGDDMSINYIMSLHKTPT